MTDKNGGPIRPHGGFRQEITVEDIERAKAARMQAADAARKKNSEQARVSGRQPNPAQ